MKLKRSFIYLLLFLLAGTLMATFMQEDSGYVRISIRNHLVETSLWFAVICLVGIFASFSILTSVLERIFASSKWFKQWRSTHGLNAARKATTKGLLAYAEGDWHKAQRLLSHSADKTDTPLINYLAAAQAANEQGNNKESDRLLKKAYDSTPGADLAVGLTQAQLQFANEKFEQCLATLVRLQKKAPHHPFLLKQLKSTYFQLGDWNKLTEIIPTLRKHKIFPAEELNELERQSWLELLASAVEEIQRAQGSSANTDPLDTVWDKLPNAMRKDEVVIHAYATHLKTLYEDKRVEALLRKTLKHHWSPKLIELYGLLNVEDSNELLIHAENWLKSRPNDDELLLALGRICISNAQWDKAVSYFEASLKLKKNPTTIAELSRLYAHLGEHEKSSGLFMETLSGQKGYAKLPQSKSAA